jgi:hypothetical protein
VPTKHGHPRTSTVPVGRIERGDNDASHVGHGSSTPNSSGSATSFSPLSEQWNGTKWTLRPAPHHHLCGTAPIDASSGKHERHRLNRGGDRQANSALWHVVLTWMVCDPRSMEYINRRTKEGLIKKEFTLE